MATAMRETAKKNLEKMVRGAAREVSAPSRDKRAGAEAAPPPSSSTEKGISKQAIQQLRSLIEKNGKTIQKVPVESIQLHENIRDGYDEGSLRHLADSLDKEGLIQFPTLALKDHNGSDGTFVCKNGHRRILAAKMLGWKAIECVILPFSSARDELYHTIAANIREDVFYLDLAAAYQQAARLGESDQAIAERSGVNPRTVGWYRRLTRMSPDCQALCRQHPDIFHATWAIKEARKGELPPPAQLLRQMQMMLARQQTLGKEKETGEAEVKPLVDKERVKASKDQLKAVFSGSKGTAEAQFAWSLIDQLCGAGYLTPKIQERLKKQFLPGASKATKRIESVLS